MRSTDEASPTQVSRVLVCRIRDIRPREGNRRPHHNIDFRHPSHSHPQPAEPRSRPSVWRQLNLGYFRNPKVVGLDRYSKYFFLNFFCCGTPRRRHGLRIATTALDTPARSGTILIPPKPAAANSAATASP